MTNCYAKLYKLEDVLEAGHPNRDTDAARISAATPIYEGVAFISSPTKAWQQASAVEGIVLLNLHLHPRSDLGDVNVVVVSNNQLAATYYVSNNGVNGDGVNWNILINRRK